MTMGRPTKYSEELLKKARYYIKNWKTFGQCVPSNGSLGKHLGISRETVNVWRNDPEKIEFREILEKISTEQEVTLIDQGLVGEFNSNICKLMLGKHGYSDKQEITGRDGEPLDRSWTVKIVRPSEIPGHPAHVEIHQIPLKDKARLKEED